MILLDILPKGESVNADRYCETLDRLRHAVQRKIPGLFRSGVVLQHDNATPHTAKRTNEWLERYRWDIIPHPAHSPDLAPSDFHLFGPLKRHLGSKNSCVKSLTSAMILQPGAAAFMFDSHSYMASPFDLFLYPGVSVCLPDLLNGASRVQTNESQRVPGLDCGQDEEEIFQPLQYRDAKGLILLDILPQGQCINATRYCSTLERLKEAIRRKRSGLLRRGAVLQHHNATPHSANLTQQWLQHYGWEILPHPAHSPDLASSEFHLFGPLKRHLGGMAFETEDDLISELRNWFDNLDVDFFRVGINSLLSRWQKCIDLHGDYVKK
ncbi:histone-lysine N-methyltransferase SETMAR [Plakobranchus ocellatus]|uniref:Histone-lysine N-methyltransferase SETMAR n=1 Tax=Plakobranchus ocellatus TaxID=259542 RepID=A0AAV3ZUF5_9GAST|nr:histone-lysine N-methyltransferase SETMAR [Plakobranchus ocellatus]